MCGDPATGMQLTAEGLRLSPCDPQRYLSSTGGSGPRFVGADYHEALACARSALAERVDLAPAHLGAAVSLTALGDLPAAQREY
jgi:hypothetical protein